MYNASEQFHTAVFRNSPVERVLLRFADNTILTNEDIHSGNGLKYMEAANLEEELTIGDCLSATLEATIMNYHGLLSGYTFGECEILLAVKTSTEMGAAEEANVMTIMRYDTSSPVKICGYSTLPYLKINGYAPTAQPPFPVRSILTVGDTLYCVNTDGEVWAAAWVDGQTWSELSASTWNEVSSEVWDGIQGVLVPLTDSTYWQELNSTLWEELATTRWRSFVVLPTFNAFMVEKLKGWAAVRRGMSFNSNVLYEFTVGGKIERYEYAKLGVFRINTPQKRKVDLISIAAYDRMTKFDVEADTFLNGLTYPITLGEVFSQLCEYVGVNRATITFINSTRSFVEAPAMTEGVTAKEVLSWIAEAACTFARMTRDGEIELAWFSEETVTIPMNQYFSIEVAEYTVAQIDKLQILNSENDIGVTIGSGTNGYQIMDNPFLYGENDTQIRTYGAPIYNRLSAFAAFSPVIATAVCDWSIQAGDMISIELNGTTYLFPIYCQTITWKGNARVSYESTGAEHRPVMDAVNRRVFSQKRSMHEISVTVDGLSSRISNAEGDITALELFANGLELSVTNGSTSSILKLMAGSTELSSQNITFTGIVTFASLSTAGMTTINGSNITTGTVAAARIDVDNLHVKHLNGADGTFTGSLNAASGTFTGSLTAASGTFTSLDAVGGLVHLGSNYIEINSVEIGYVHGYSQVCIIGPGYEQGNIGSGNIPWSQCVAKYLYSSNGSVNSYSMRKLKRNIKPYSLPDGAIDKFQMNTFVMKNDKENRVQIGYIADDVREICPYLVTEFKDDGMEEAILTMDYSKVGVIAIDELQKFKTITLSAIKELQARVEELEQMTGGLENG